MSGSLMDEVFTYHGDGSDDLFIAMMASAGLVPVVVKKKGRDMLEFYAPEILKRLTNDGYEYRLIDYSTGNKG